MNKYEEEVLAEEEESKSVHDTLIKALEHIDCFEDVIVLGLIKDSGTMVVYHSPMNPHETIGALEAGAIIQKEFLENRCRELNDES